MARRRKQDPGPRAEAVSHDLEVTFGLVSLTEVTPRLWEIGRGWRPEMTFEFVLNVTFLFAQLE